MFIPESGETIRAALDADPAVKAGRLKVEVHPQFMGAGVLRKRGDSEPAPGEEPKK